MFATVYSHTRQVIIPTAESSGPNLMHDDGSKKYGKIQDGLESSISIEGRARITRILGEVHSLTDVEKLLLYLKLPTGVVPDDQNRLTPPSCLPTSNRKEQGEAFTWIKSHLEEHADVCMPKAEVYDEYRQYCEQHELRPLCNADFGKMMKQVFPDINTRRLGQRGQSKYFYGGLRKKTEHTPPTLPELEVTAKNIEIDSNAMDSEIFKSSCQVVGEWADKLLDMKFSGVQDIAEHLIVNTFVNTKSVAAFTLIAAMQESGKYNLKDSALFSTQPSVGGDKHKETNLLLQRKLQQNKEIQKQKEKAQALREEIKSHSGSHGNQTRSKTPVSNQRKSVVVSTSASNKSSRSLSTTSSPITRQSPQIQQSPRKQVSPWLQQKTGQQGQAIETGSKPSTENRKCVVNLQQTVAQSTDLNSKSANGINNWKQNVPGSFNKTGLPKKVVSGKELSRGELVEIDGYKLMDNDYSDIPNKNSGNELSEGKPVEIDGYKLMDTDYIGTLAKNCEINVFEAKTPETCMETDQSELSHVRKIDFDDCVTEHHENNKVVNQSKEQEGIENKAGDTAEAEGASVNKLSKSTGYLSLKKMLENKCEDQSNLNKSMGCLGNTKNALFVNQSTVPGRSAFVPFSQVQSLCRKEGTSVNQSVAMAIPVIIPSVAQTKSSKTPSQSANITMIALPADLQTSPIKGSSEVLQKESFFSILPASNVFQQASGASSTDSALPAINIQNQTKESTSVVTVSSVLSKMAGSECVVSSAQSWQNLPKQLRTKFTPIRPKASPNKTQPQKETKVETPGYDKDKRPVSAILKEKRAKEQAEAIAKFQSSIRLPAIPFQQNISFTGNQLSGLQGIQAASSNVPASEVVIIVNNQQVKLQQVIGPNSVADNTSSNKKSTPSDIDINSDKLGKGQNSNNKENTSVNSVKSIENYHKESQNPSVSQNTKSETDNSCDYKDNEDNLSDLKEFSPMSGGSDITQIVGEDDDFNNLSEQDIHIESNVDMELGTSENPVNVDEHVKEKMSSEAVDQMWMETPRKIQKLNITSPFQEECSLSLGRDTPVRIPKTSDLSRPDSACSYGRETPSGTRKRKSSDFHAQRNFKRLNSTGEESEDSQNLSLVLSPDRENPSGLVPRRTHSCTFELERETKGSSQQQHQQQQKLNSVSSLLLPGLQSPDIHSLEREALIESFPNSMYAMKPQHKSHRNQSSSVGVSAKSFRQSQQKLIKQQQYLDERVKNFLQTQMDTNENSPKGSNAPVSNNSDQLKTSQISPGSRSSLKADGLVVTDRGKPYQRPSSVATVGNRGSNLEIEPSGLPSEVADWINDTIEKRQKENQSAMSEPEFREYQSSKGNGNVKLQNFRFEVSNALQKGTTGTCDDQVKNMKESFKLKITKQPQNDDNNFTVPKAPPVSNQRSKDMLRLNTDISSQRCQSLPIFASPVQSPVSPMGPPGNRNSVNQRASSMSPRAQASDSSGEMMSPTSFGLLAPVRRKELRDGQALSPGQTGLYPGQSKQGTYLASIQHSLQKPVDTPQETLSPQDGPLGKHPLAGFVSVGKCQMLMSNRSRESSLDADDRFVSKTPFSDSGYHSSGPSPILNSTPVSTADNPEFLHGQTRNIVRHKQQITESPITMVTDFTNPHQLSPQQVLTRPQLSMHQQNISIATSQFSNSGMNPSQLRSSIHSAFIPIQGSHHDVHYVAPIKPVVTLPSNTVEHNPGATDTDSSKSMFIDTGQTVLGSDITMVSPRSADPPSYEVAIKQLKKSTPPKPVVVSQNQPSEILNSIDMVKEQSRKYDQQQSLLNKLGSENGAESLGPFAQKLFILSQHTQNTGKDIQTLLRGEFKTNPVTDKSNQFIPDGTDLSNMSDNVSGFQTNISGCKENRNGANSDFGFPGDVNLCLDSQIPFEQRQTILKSNSANNSVLTNNFPEHSVLVSNTISSENVLNIAPSFNPSPHFGSANQTAENHSLPSIHHHDIVEIKLNEENQLLNKPQFSMQRDLNETQRFQVSSTEINIFNNDGAFNRDDNPGAIKNLLIGGKLISQDLDMVVENGQNKQEEVIQQELMDDIGLPWESLREIEGDLEDFNMFN